MEVSDKSRYSLKTFLLHFFILSDTYLCLYSVLAEKERYSYLALNGTLTFSCDCNSATF